MTTKNGLGGQSDGPFLFIFEAIEVYPFWGWGASLQKGEIMFTLIIGLFY
jgi:hypothetical protein